MDTERENLRQLFLDFIDTQPDDEWDDTDAWKRYLQTYDDLLAEVEQLQKELEESKENFKLFRDSVVRPVLKHVYSKEEEHKKLQVMIHALRCAQADLQGILPEFEPGGDREHSGWQTLEELNELLARIDN